MDLMGTRLQEFARSDRQAQPAPGEVKARGAPGEPCAEVGVSVGKGKVIVTAGVAPGEKPQCDGKTEVAPTSITGKYACRGITAYDAATGTMGTVDVMLSFRATS